MKVNECFTEGTCVIEQCLALTLTMTLLAGCSPSRSLDPPADSEMVTVQVVVPPELKPNPITISYRSDECLVSRNDVNLNRYLTASYNGYRAEWEYESETGTYEIKIARDGGGDCKWRLNQIWYSLTYTDPEYYGPGVVAGSGGRMVINFLEPSGSNGLFYAIKGDHRVYSEIYPWIYDVGPGGMNLLGMMGEGGGGYAPDAKLIRYEATLQKDYVTRSIRGKKKGDPITFEYPNGDVVSDGSMHPDRSKIKVSRTGRDPTCFNPFNYLRCPDGRPKLSPYPIDVPGAPAHHIYWVTNEWGNQIFATMRYRILGADGSVHEGETYGRGYTEAIPDSALPFVDVKIAKPGHK